MYSDTCQILEQLICDFYLISRKMAFVLVVLFTFELTWFFNTFGHLVPNLTFSSLPWQFHFERLVFIMWVNKLRH